MHTHNMQWYFPFLPHRFVWNGVHRLSLSIKLSMWISVVCSTNVCKNLKIHNNNARSTAAQYGEQRLMRFSPFNFFFHKSRSAHMPAHIRVCVLVHALTHSLTHFRSLLSHRVLYFCCDLSCVQNVRVCAPMLSMAAAQRSYICMCACLRIHMYWCMSLSLLPPHRKHCTINGYTVHWYCRH